MSTNIKFRGATPDATTPPATGGEDGTADIVQVDKALESWRDAGFDLTAAIGEVVDNSIEARASLVRIRTMPGQVTAAKKIEAIAFADDGIGIDPAILANVLSLGFSTRYNQRNGLGRFGVGLKLAALSHAKRIDLYTRQAGSDAIWHAYLDLELISDGSQTVITRTEVKAWPAEFADLMIHADGTPQEAGTLVVWSKVDRLASGGTFKTDLNQRFKEAQQFLARAYRKFLDKGLSIELNGRAVTLHDPTFQLHNPRVDEKLGADVRGTILSRDKIEIDGNEVHVTVSLAPEALRRERFKGGDQLRQDLQVPDNEGRISFLRQGREINYDQVARMFPSRIEEIDRYIGIEVEFPAALDEYFQVRHVKRGVVPVDKLRTQLKKILERPITGARKEIRERFDVTEAERRNLEETHETATTAVAQVEQSAPRGKAGAEMSSDDEQSRVDEVAAELTADAGIDGDDTEAGDRDAATKKLRDAVARLPITLVDSTWPGKELLDITHLNGKAIVKINHGHPFIREVYDSARRIAELTPTDINPGEMIRFARKVEIGIDVLLMAYAKAENMHREPDLAYSDLRTYWGSSTAAYVTESFREI